MADECDHVQMRNLKLRHRVASRALQPVATLGQRVFGLSPSPWYQRAVIRKLPLLRALLDFHIQFLAMNFGKNKVC